MNNFITPELLDELGFKIVKNPDLNRGYGKAVDKKTGWMTMLYWNCEGCSCTYFGDKLEDNIGLSIRKDNDTRNAFNGYIYTVEDLKKVISLTW